ncbi:hypothetical protein BWP24_21370 [Vibrio campbellii]|uniref:hypothetical protein n=1 Tax=Vibrio campbellii TaxID=680 RepID=UPI00097186FD|nr:hypothetical protein [Vibrio campbellii]APX08725.1 hypothetical protein BWP24_21345 [Vibrio campbellii]APX08729.1 hypothetical protein BWP24_21370 [Vibrio campbellii]
MSNQSVFSTILTSYHAYSDEPKVQRLFAVQAALEVIKADVGSGGEKKYPNTINNMDNLSKYADLIQEALDK